LPPKALQTAKFASAAAQNRNPQATLSHGFRQQINAFSGSAGAEDSARIAERAIRNSPYGPAKRRPIFIRTAVIWRA
jgi:hypothetical protein